MLAPLHIAAQSFIERHFNRRSHETARAIEAFAATLREEIDLDTVRDGLLAVVWQTMGSQSISLWVRKAAQNERDNELLQTGREEYSERSGAYTWTQQDMAHEKPCNLSLCEIVVSDNDPMLAFALSHPGVIVVNRLRLSSPMLQAWQAD